MSHQWYIRRPGRFSAPLSIGELRQQAADGRLSPDAWVSLDLRRWIRAAQVEGLDFPASRQNRPSSQAAPSAGQEAGEDSVSARKPADSGTGSGAGLLGAAKDLAGKVKEAVRPEKLN